MRRFRQQSLILVLGLSILLIFINSSLQRTNVVVAGALNYQYHCFVITNLNQYPDYLFIVLQKSKYPNTTPSNEVLQSDYCFFPRFYSDNFYAKVYALKKSEINLEEDIIEYVGEHEFLDRKKTYKKLNDFESKISKLIPAKDKIHSLSQVVIGTGGNIPPIYDYYEIRNISDTALVLNKKEKRQIFSILGILLIVGVLLGGIIYWQKVSKSNKIES